MMVTLRQCSRASERMVCIMVGWHRNQVHRIDRLMGRCPVRDPESVIPPNFVRIGPSIDLRGRSLILKTRTRLESQVPGF